MIISRFRHILLVIFTIASILLALLQLSSLLLVWVKPYLLGSYVYLGFGFTALFVANILSFIYWTVRWRVQMLIPLFAITLTWTLWSQTFQSGWRGQTVTQNPSAIKILSYNVRMFDFYNWSKIDGSTNKMFAFIKRADADVVCFQEYFTRSIHKEFSEKGINAKLKQYPYHVLHYSSLGNSDGYGIAIYSRFPIVNKGVVGFENTANSAIYVDINVSGTTIRLFNAHLESLRLDQSHLDLINRMEYPSDHVEEQELDEIGSRIKNALRDRTIQSMKIASLIEKSPYRTFVCGDFNDVPVSYVYNTIKGKMSDSFVSQGSGFGGTYFGFKVPFRIDYLLYSKDIECVSYKRFDVLFSDHRPIMGSYLLR